MIYFRNYNLRLNFVISHGATVRDKNDQIIRGVTPVTAIVIMYNPLDMDTYAHKAANGLTREDARRKAVFKARRELLKLVKDKKPTIAHLSSGEWRVKAKVRDAFITGYGPTYEEALHNVFGAGLEMDRICNDIIEPVKIKTEFTIWEHIVRLVTCKSQ